MRLRQLDLANRSPVYGLTREENGVGLRQLRLVEAMFSKYPPQDQAMDDA